MEPAHLAGELVTHLQRELLAMELALQLLYRHLQLSHLRLARLQLLECGVTGRERVVLTLAALAGEQSAQLEHLLHQDAAASGEREDGVACRCQLALRFRKRRAQAGNLHFGLCCRGSLSACLLARWRRGRQRDHPRSSEAAAGCWGAIRGGFRSRCAQCGGWHAGRQRCVLR